MDCGGLGQICPQWWSCLLHTCCRMWVQGNPVNECMYPHPQPLSLPTPGPCKAYYHDCTENRHIPGRGPADNPASLQGKVVYIGNYQLNHNQEECIPLGEECGPPEACRRALHMPVHLACALHLCGFPVVQGPPYRAVPQGLLAGPLVPVHVTPQWQEQWCAWGTQANG